MGGSPAATETALKPVSQVRQIDTYWETDVHQPTERDVPAPNETRPAAATGALDFTLRTNTESPFLDEMVILQDLA